jgi:hypothetical protein
MRVSHWRRNATPGRREAQPREPGDLPPASQFNPSWKGWLKLSVSRFVRAVLLAAPVAAIICASPVSAQARSKDQTVGASLRVVDPAASNLAGFTAYTTTSTLPTSKGAKCFGQGTGGSGDSFTLKGATALGLLEDGSKFYSGLRPLSITDHFLDSFGPGLCGIGSSVASGNSYWDLIVNHEESQIGGGQKIHQGDQVLWYLAPSFPAGPELRLQVPSIVPAAGDYPATVDQYDLSTGARSPAQGVSVDFASQPTDSAGHTTIHVNGSSGSVAAVGATRGTDAAIPDKALVCIGTAQTCSAVSNNSIFGSKQADRIATTPQADFVAAGKGNDTIKITAGGVDNVDCGGGKDTVIRRRSDHDDHIHNCEKVIKR